MERSLSRYWRDVAWQSSGNSLAQFVAVLGIPVLTRLYGPEEFAVQSLFIQVVTYATALVTWRYEFFIQLPKLDDEVRALNGLVLTFGLLAVLVLTPLLWSFRHALAQQLGHAGLAPWLFLAPATAVLVSWAVAAQNNAQRHGDFKTSGLSELVGKLAYVSTGIAGAVAQLGALGLIATTAIGAAGKSAYVLLHRQARGRAPSRPELGAMRSVRDRYGRLATSTVLSHVLTTSAIAVPQVAMAHLYGAEMLGQFALVLATIYLPTALLGAAMGQVYYQRAGKLWAAGSSFHGLWRETARRLLIVGVPVYGIIAWLSPLAYPLIFGEQWRPAGELATWMAVAAFGSFVSSPMDRTCLVVGAGLYSILWSLYRVASTLVVVWLARVQGFDPLGFIGALVIQMCTAYGIDLWMSRRFSLGRLGPFVRSSLTEPR